MAMTNTLKFLRTFTLDEFKEWKGILQIRIIRNEQTGKYFFGYGDKAGAVTSKYPAEPVSYTHLTLPQNRSIIPSFRR